MRRNYLIPDYSVNRYIIIMNISSTEAKKCCLLPNETIIKSLVRIDNDIQMPVCQIYKHSMEAHPHSYIILGCRVLNVGAMRRVPHIR